MKIAAEVDEAQDPVRTALTEQEQEEIYSYSRRLFAEGDDPEKGFPREQFWKSDDRCCVCG
eukprot:5731336-Amphidinium_carterae.1